MGNNSKLGEHRQPAAPSLACDERVSGGQHRPTDDGEPDRGAQSVDHVLVRPGEPTEHQHGGHHQRSHALQDDDPSRAAHGGRGGRIAGQVTASA